MLKLYEWSERDLNIFLVSLRCLIRSLNASCLISAYVGNERENGLKAVIRKNTDFVFAIKEINEEGKFIDYCGLIEIVKPLRIQSLGNYEFNAHFYGITKDNKFINIENLSLPPAESLQKPTLDY